MKKLLFLSVIVALVLISCSKDQLTVPGDNDSDPPPTEKSVTFLITPILDNEGGSIAVNGSWAYFYYQGIIDQGTGDLKMNTVNEFTFTGELAEKLLNAPDSLYVSVAVQISHNGNFVNTKYQPNSTIAIKVNKENVLQWEVSRWK